MKPASLLWLAMMAWLPAMASGAFFKCTVDGVVVYQDSPCADGGGAMKSLPPLTPMGPVGGKTGKGGKAAKPGGGNSKPVDTQAADGASAGWYSGVSGYHSAMMESARTDVPAVVYFYATWCGYCKKVERDVFPSEKVASRLRRVIKVRIDSEADREASALFRSLGGHGIPFALGGVGSSNLQKLHFGNYQPDIFAGELDRLLGAARKSR